MLKAVALTLSLACAFASTSPARAESPGSLQIYVSKNAQSLAVYDGDKVIASSKVSTGKAGHATPSGIFSILEKRKYHESNIYSNAPMPWMQRLTWSGIAFHEGHVPNHPASHGCIRLPAEFARALFKMTSRGVHVVITEDPVTPQVVTHAALFKPQLPKPDGALLSDAELRPTAYDAGHPVEVAMVEVLPKVGAQAKVEITREAPIRILITRRGTRETVLDIQTMLNTLGFDAGVPDGLLGSRTLAAVAAFKTEKELPAKGGALATDFLDALYAAAGKGAPPNGHILVRQTFKPLFEAPVTIKDAEKPLGTHFLEATYVNRFSGAAEWRGVTLDNHIPAAARKRLGIDADGMPETIEAALDRVSIPADVRERIALLLDQGSSLTISDVSDPNETGLGTDFITTTRPAQPAKRG